MSHPSFRRHAGFTLIEMLTVVAIIGVLATIVIAGMGYVKETQKFKTAKIQVELLTNACEEFKRDHGYYPGRADNSPGNGKNMSNELFQELYWDSNRDGLGPKQDSNQKVYITELDPEHNKQRWTEGTGKAAKIVDPWGNEYRYRKGSSSINPDFDLWSVGKDGKTNTSNLKDKDCLDDIHN